MLLGGSLHQHSLFNPSSSPLWPTLATSLVRSRSPKRTFPVFAARTCFLPDGRLVHYVSKRDVAFLYHEIFEKRAYLQHGVQLHPGDCVVDVGANIGLFAAFAAEAVGREGKVVALEPIPPVFQAALANMHSLVTEGWGVVKAVNVGVGDGSSDHALFTFYPAAAGWSTMLPDSDEVSEAMVLYLDNALATMEGMDRTALARAGSLVKRIAPSWLSRALTRAFVGRMLAQQRHYQCPLTTVSAVMAQEGLHCVNLLKIDVERAELEVLQGVEEADWPKVQQLVVEVHDVEGRLGAVQALLQGKAGFKACIVDQDDQLTGSALHTVYCRRQQLR